MKFRATMRDKLVFILGIREVPFIENRFTQKPKSCPACKQKARSFYKERGKWTTISGKKREKRKAKAFLLVIHGFYVQKVHRHPSCHQDVHFPPDFLSNCLQQLQFHPVRSYGSAQTMVNKTVFSVLAALTLF